MAQPTITIKISNITDAHLHTLFTALGASGAEVSVAAPATQDERKANNKPAVPMFDSFWAAYPRKTGKGAARKAWVKMECEVDANAVIAAVHRNTAKNEQWLKDGGQFIPHPVTWLNQERWLDEIGVGADAQRAQEIARYEAVMADLGPRGHKATPAGGEG